MAQFPCLPLWTDAWLADTAHLSRAERGTYLDLLVLMWRTPGCRVPNDDQWLGRRLHMSPAEVMTDLRPIVAEFCQTDGNWLIQKRLKREHNNRFEYGKVQSVRAKSRWRKEKKDARAGNASFPSLNTHRSSLKWIDPALVLNVDNSPTELAEPKQAAAEKEPAEMTLSELNRRWRGR